MDVHPARGTRAPLGPFPRLTTGKVIAAAERGAITVPDLVRARGAGDLTRCETKAVDGVLYAKPTSAGFIMMIR